MDLAEVIYNNLVAQAQLCTSLDDIETATSVKIKIAEVVHILVHPRRTSEELGLIARLLRLENSLTFFLSKKLGQELKVLIRSENQEESPDR